MGPLTRIVALVILAWSTACSPVGPPSRVAPELPEIPEIPLAAGEPSRDDAREAAEWTTEAQRALDVGNWQGAAGVATRVIEQHPAAGSAGHALWIRAQALGRIEAGADQAVALDDLERLLPVLPEASPLRAPAQILRGRLLVERGDRIEGLRAALMLPPRANVTTRDLAWARDWANRLDVEELEVVVDGIDLSQPLAAPVFVAFGQKLGEQGRAEEAREAAESALAGGALDTDREAAEALLAGVGVAEDRTMAERIPLAAILPQSGSPSLQRFSVALEEGIQAAIQAAEMTDRAEVEVYDDGGDPVAAANLIRSAEGERVFGVVGPVQERAFSEAAASRSGELPIISPSAYSVPSGVSSVYSLGSLDPSAATELATWAAETGILSVAIIHANDPGSSEEARLFEEAFTAAGGQIVRRLNYPPGTTFFEEQVMSAAAARPDAILFPVPAQDVEALAPQVSFFGLDTLGIQILGTAGWTDPVVRERVQPRNLNGVVTASPDLTRAEGYERFRQGYEQRFQRTLRDDGSAALGYDAAALLLKAAESGARSAGELARALEQIEDFPGATGRLSVRDGRIVRAHLIVCYSGSEPVPIELERPVQVYRPYPSDPDEPPVADPGPGRRAGFACPGTPEGDRARAYLESIRGVRPGAPFQDRSPF